MTKLKQVEEVHSLLTNLLAILEGQKEKTGLEE